MTRSCASRTSGLRAARERARAQVLLDGELGEDPPALHHLRDAAADDRRRRRGRRSRSPSSSTEPLVISPRWTPSRPVIARSSVVLPAPLAPSSATIGALGDVEADAAQHQHDVVVDDLEVADGQDIGAASGAAASPRAVAARVACAGWLASLLPWPRISTRAAGCAPAAAVRHIRGGSRPRAGGSDSGSPGSGASSSSRSAGGPSGWSWTSGVAVLGRGPLVGDVGVVGRDRRLGHAPGAYPQLRRRSPRVQDLGDLDAPVLALAVLEQRDQRAPDRDGGAVERVDVARARRPPRGGSGCRAAGTGSRSCSRSRSARGSAAGPGSHASRSYFFVAELPRSSTAMLTTRYGTLSA